MHITSTVREPRCTCLLSLSSDLTTRWPLERLAFLLPLTRSELSSLRLKARQAELNSALFKSHGRCGGLRCLYDETCSLYLFEVWWQMVRCDGSFKRPSTVWRRAQKQSPQRARTEDLLRRRRCGCNRPLLCGRGLPVASCHCSCPGSSVRTTAHADASW